MDSQYPTTSSAQFNIGQIVHHKKFDYRGVIFDIDSFYSLSDEWYEKMAKSRPPKHEPWYHLLVNNQSYTTYVAERHLESDDNHEPIHHPMLKQFFETSKCGRYHIKNKTN